MKESYKGDVTDEEVISSFVEKQVILTLAEELNSTVTEKELSEVIEYERSFYEDGLSEDQ